MPRQQVVAASQHAPQAIQCQPRRPRLPTSPAKEVWTEKGWKKKLRWTHRRLERKMVQAVQVLWKKKFQAVQVLWKKKLRWTHRRLERKMVQAVQVLVVPATLLDVGLRGSVGARRRVHACCQWCRTSACQAKRARTCCQWRWACASEACALSSLGEGPRYCAWAAAHSAPLLICAFQESAQATAPA